MKVKFLIIGGGVAGLCAAIRLAELGEESVLIEGGSYPAHKICGEFLSPECMHVLHDWNICPLPISEMVLKTSNNYVNFSFPSSAGGMSHIQLDTALAERASQYGVQIKTNTQVCSLMPKRSSKESHLIQLSSGETLEALQVIIATGRIPGYNIKAPLMSYIGFKAHFKDIASDGILEMFSMPGAYLGIAPVEGQACNVACLAELKQVQTFADPQDFIENLISLNSHLYQRLTKENNLFEKWMFAKVPDFGIKQTPDWLDAYYIGDAAATIPPACGNGLALAISSGRLAAEYAINKRSQDFKRIWKKRCSSQIFWGKLLHRAMLNPCYLNPLLNLAGFFPILSRKTYHFTRRAS